MSFNALFTAGEGRIPDCIRPWLRRVFKI